VSSTYPDVTNNFTKEGLARRSNIFIRIRNLYFAAGVASLKLTGMVLALLISFGGLAGMGCGNAAAIDMPGPCHDIEISTIDDSILIRGNVPDNYEGAEIRGVHIYRGLDPGNLSLLYTLKVYTNTARFFLYQDTGISNGIVYYYSVAAFNVLGEGNRSEVLSAMSTGAPPAPQGLTASVTCAHVHLYWSPPVSDGGSPLTHYSIFRGLRGSEPALIANVTGHSYDDTNVTFDDSFYNYEVCAINENGMGKRSMTVFASLPMPVVSGRLTGTNGTPVAGAIVEIDSNSTVACTDSNGTFSIAMTPGSHTLTVWVGGNAVHRMDVVAPVGSHDLGEILIDEPDESSPGVGLETFAFAGIIAIVTAGMVIWATGKAKIR
jgi:hypothetical protein